MCQSVTQHILHHICEQPWYVAWPINTLKRTLLESNVFSCVFVLKTSPKDRSISIHIQYHCASNFWHGSMPTLDSSRVYAHISLLTSIDRLWISECTKLTFMEQCGATVLTSGKHATPDCDSLAVSDLSTLYPSWWRKETWPTPLVHEDIDISEDAVRQAMASDLVICRCSEHCR